jgi:hypothetical protein
MPATSTRHETLTPCDVSDLKNVPEYAEPDWIALHGASPSQVSYGANVRARKMTEWEPDLPKNVWNALRGVDDATWWLANQNNDSSNVRWPQSWVPGTPRNPGPPPTTGQRDLPPARDKNRELLEGYGAGAVKLHDLEQFEKFALKACRSPELSYMTIMALLFRQTRDERVKELFTKAREAVQNHLDAIDNILGK